MSVFEFRHLQSFLAIADELHFGRAAARLHLAQPSLSQHLRRLERDVGAALVHRTSHEVRLTPAGEAFRTEALRVVAQAARAVAAARDAAEGRSGKITVGFNFPAGRLVLPAALARLAVDRPGVAVQLAERPSGPQLAALAAGTQDVGFVYGRPVDLGLTSRELLTLPVVAVVGEQHPWARRSSIAVRELAEQPCVLSRREQSPALYDAVTGAAARAGVELRPVEGVDDPAGTGLMLASRRLVGFGSQVRGAAAHGLVPIPLTGPTPQLDLHMVWRAPGSPPVEAFLNCVVGPFAADRPAA